MYRNYGDKDFFEHGRLADTDHSDTAVDILFCDPYEDCGYCQEYMFGHACVDTTDSWIDRKAVRSFAGLADGEDDPALYAVACLDYYGPENFGAGSYATGYDWRHCSREQAEDILKHFQIASDGLDMTWLEPTGWISTDASCAQHVRPLGGRKFQLVQYETADPETGEMLVREEEIDLDRLEAREIEGAVKGFGYKSVDDVRSQYGEASDQVVAECVFELHDWSLSDSYRYEPSEEAAEAAVKAFIYERRPSLY